MRVASAGRLRLLAGVTLALWEAEASAIPFEVFVDVEDEQAIYDLRTSEQISADSFNALLLLYQTKVDLDQADRDRLYALPNLELAHVDAILRFRAEHGSVGSLGLLVNAGILSPRLARTLDAFVEPSDMTGASVAGFLRVQVQTTGRTDRQPPAAAVQSRVKAISSVDAAVVLVLTRSEVGGLRWDPAREGLSVTPEKPRLAVPKFYFAWDRARWGIIAGTFRIGFGQRLTFDVTNQSLPNGFFGDLEVRRGDSLIRRCRRGAGELVLAPCPDDRDVRVGPDFSWTERLTGVAVGARSIDVGHGSLQLYAWGSHQVLSPQSFELARTDACPDPRRDELPGCRAPRVYVRDRPGPQAVVPAGRIRGAAAETLAGGNIGVVWGPRARAGVTGYAAVPRFRIGGASLGYQESARRPFGGPFGAVGVDVALGFRSQDFFVEATRSFDSQPGRGGFAGLVRSVTDLPTTEIDVSARYYGARFANPYARSLSAPDETDGLRTRNESGLRVRTTSQLGARVALRTYADLWRRTNAAGARADLYVRADVAITDQWSWALSASYRRGAAQRLGAIGRATLSLGSAFSAAAQCVLAWRGLSGEPTRRDTRALLDVSTRLGARVGFHGRIRYDVEGAATRANRAQRLGGYVRLVASLRGRDRVGVRYDVQAFVDARESTRRRVPNPEHWLWLEYVARF
ncbi:MAG: hypothetical protein AAGF92_18065 [Myxococcota bacterium]